MSPAPQNIQAGVPIDIAFAVRRESVTRRLPDGREVKENVTEFDEVHERFFHLFVVRDDMGSFAHEHPAPDGDGVFKWRFTFPAAGTYRLFADVAPKGAGSQVLRAELFVAGAPTGRFDITAVRRALAGRNADVKLRWTLTQDRLAARKTQVVRVSILHESGEPVTDIEPWLGAMGHLLLVHQDGETFAHAHPDERVRDIGRNGVIPFTVYLPKPGLYHSWLQFGRRGQVVTLDFVVEGY
jgi:hypothetical protein